MRVAMLGVVLALGCAGCASGGAAPTATVTSTVTVTTTPVPVTSPTPPITPGIYVDGAPGTPHYFTTLTAGPGDTIAGTLAFVAQDGQTTEAHPFVGTVVDGIATLNFKDGSTGTASVETAGFELGECQQWMKFAQSRADCAFHRAESIN